MGVKLTAKAQRLYDCIREKGGGVIEEWRMLDKTGMSHGSFCAARKELVAAGLLLLGKDVRKTTYTLAEPSVLTVKKPLLPPPPAVKALVAGKATGGTAKSPAPQVQEAIMPRVTGDYADIDDWFMALNDRFGGCVDVSQSLVDGQEYTVFVDEYGEDSYTVTENADGGITVE